MKELIQQTGVRKWFGDEWITLQTELMAILEGHFGQFNQQFILSGCVVNGTTVSAGIICLKSGNTYKLYRFAGATGVTFPVYFTTEAVEDTRLYMDGNVKPVAVDNNAILTSVFATNLLELKADGSTARFTDAIQDNAHRFCTDTEKASYAGQAAAAIAALRDGVASNFNTLKKIKDYIDLLDVQPVDIDALKAELRGGVDASLDTMKKIVDYINGLTYLPTFQGTSNLSGNTIDWRDTPERTKTLTAATQIDASNLIVGKTIGLKVSGAFALTFSAKFKKAIGSPDPSQSLINYVQMKCINAASGSEYIIYSIIYLNS
jgi:hypothetical protein